MRGHGQGRSRTVFPDLKRRGTVRRHFAADLGDGLAYREAFTTDIAQEVVAHLVNDRRLQLGLGPT